MTLLKKLFVTIILSAAALTAGAQELFHASSASFTDARGEHEIFQSLTAPPIEMTDLGTSVVLIMGDDTMTLVQEPDNPLEYRYNLKGRKRHQQIITKAYRDGRSGKIERITVTTLDPAKDVNAMVITFRPVPVGLPADGDDSENEE